MDADPTQKLLLDEPILAADRRLSQRIYDEVQAQQAAEDASKRPSSLDGKTIAKSKQAKFNVRVHAKAKKFGRHVIRIIARGAGGRTVRVLEFRRCGRPVQPRFVG